METPVLPQNVEPRLGGSFHPPRVAQGDWARLLAQARADGLNHVQIYVFWNFHERTKGEHLGFFYLSEFQTCTKKSTAHAWAKPGFGTFCTIYIFSDRGHRALSSRARV